MIRRLGLIGAALLLAVVWIGWLGAIRDPVITRQRVELAGLSRPLRIVHLSDFHGSALDMPEVRIARIVAQANALRPDLIVITGDFGPSKLWEPPLPLDAVLRPLARLQAPLGVWSVAGNHDDPALIRAAMRRQGLNLLAGDLVDAGPVQIIGIDDLILGQGQWRGLASAAARIDPARPVIALAHEPDYFRRLPARIGLLLAGHTHGGQIRIAGHPRLLPRYERWRHGLYRNAAGQQLLVSAGLGTTFVPLRIGVPPEIGLIDLQPADQPPGRNSGTER